MTLNITWDMGIAMGHGIEKGREDWEGAHKEKKETESLSVSINYTCVVILMLSVHSHAL